MQMLISDANIIIDLEVGEQLENMFKLPYTFCTPDILFMGELALDHANLVELGLQLKTLTPASMFYAYQINAVYPQPSINDMLALALARQEDCPLLTGDKKLKKSATQESVVVRGTLWLIETLVEMRIITCDQAIASYELMQQQGRRLPFKMAKERILEKRLD